MPETHQSSESGNPLLMWKGHSPLVLVHMESENTNTYQLLLQPQQLWTFKPCSCTAQYVNSFSFHDCNVAALHVVISKRRTIPPSHFSGRLENVFSALRAGSEQLAVNKAEDHRLTVRLAGKINKYWHSLLFPSLHWMVQKSVKQKVDGYSVKSHRRGERWPQRLILALKILTSCPVVSWQRRACIGLKIGSDSRFALRQVCLSPLTEEGPGAGSISRAALCFVNFSLCHTANT